MWFENFLKHKKSSVIYNFFFSKSFTDLNCLLQIKISQ